VSFIKLVIFVLDVSPTFSQETLKSTQMRRLLTCSKS